jgi:hypothetical protein
MGTPGAAGPSPCEGAYDTISKNNECHVRSQGDWLYMAQSQGLVRFSPNGFG